MAAEKYLKRMKSEPKPVGEWSTAEWEAAYNIIAQKNKMLIASLGNALQILSRAVGTAI